ncbi:MAG: PEP-CTERM sorting domain-containing protein [Nitrospiraceae bacterium]|nr:PEP-CTERM sorting domain-containing protein [Nitrospiraceae bacterium]
MKSKINLFLGIVLVMLIASPVFAKDITIFDGWYNSGSSNSWYNTKNENNEVEPPDATGQKWDLERFVQNNTKLQVIGGFNFFTGVTDPNNGRIIKAGDIFIDIHNNAKYGSNIGALSYVSSSTIRNTFGWDYVIVPNFRTMTYDVYGINSNSILSIPYYNENLKSSPWRYASGSTQLIKDDMPLVKLILANDGEGSHYGFEVDLGFLPHDQQFLVHTTIECGNDMMMGRGILTPEPSTIILFGAGLVGLGFCARRRFNG